MHNRYDRFRGYTIAQRFPKIIDGIARAAAEADIDTDIGTVLLEIEADIAISIDQCPEGWEAWRASWMGKRPSQMPFLDFEYWFYYRILELTGHFQSGFDPFGSLKRAELNACLPLAEASFARTPTLADALDLSLNGNAMDLSQIAHRAATFNLGKAAGLAPAMSGRTLNIIGDNYGAEFLADLILGVRHAQEAGGKVRIHVKRLPLFVSDTTAVDVVYFISELERMAPSGDGFRRAVLDLLADGRMVFEPHQFWSSPYNLEAIPDGIGITDDDFTILKGDLNYRRAIGDVVCPIDTRFSELPSRPRYSMLALRSVKSYCLAGIEPAQWPPSLSTEDFPMDGSIFTAQEIASGRS